jgi:purine-binding chemotaxis protein CheW
MSNEKIAATARGGADLAADTARQYLSFRLGEEVFAIPIERVREVLDLTTITRVPQTPEFMRGVINLRGGVVPVVDVKRKFGMGRTERAISACIIIVEVEIEGEPTVLGALADSVKAVVDLRDSDIEPPPRIGTQIRTEFLSGMGKHGADFILILDIDRIFTIEELTGVARAEHEA